MKRILINATQSEELRVAIVDATNQNLLDLLVERQSYITKTGNIYMGSITAIEPSLDACFVNFGSERHGFLPFKEIAPNYYTSDLSKPTRPSIKDALKIGQSIMVQVEKEERGNKGAALTTYVSLAGSYLVLMPNNPRAGGISRRVEGDDRDDLREVLSNLPIPDEMGLIVRTAGVGKAANELQWDLGTLLKQWEAIQKAAAERSPPFLIYQESDIVIRAIRDHLRDDVNEILVDDNKIFQRIKEHLEQIRPDFVNCLKLYTSPIPLFNRYQIEHQIEAAHEREVRLPSGGSIVIGHTEALVAIDVNSGQATKGKDIEQTAFEINKEAARVIACQLRLRDIGGLIVIDFIDMPSIRHRREVENELRDALKLDKARTQVGNISPRFGLLELSRQRLRHSLGEATRTVCSRCDGWGTIRSVESLSLSILRMIEEDAIRPGTVQIQVQLPVDLATFIINEKREHIAGIEKSQKIHILLIPNAKLESPHYRVRRLTESETTGFAKPSYRLAEVEEQDTLYRKGGQIKAPEEKPAVQSLFADTSPTLKKATPSLMKRLLANLFGSSAETATPKPATLATPTPSANVPDRSPRNQERAHQRGQRHTGHARKSRGISSRDRKTPPMAAGTSAAPSSRNGQQDRPRRNDRGRNMADGAQKRAHLPTPPQPVKLETLNPPNYLQQTLSDSDLELYYQESAAFTNRKSSKTPVTPGASEVPNKPAVTTEESTLHKSSEAAPISYPSTAHPVTATPVKPVVVDADKYWTPHKIAPAPSHVTKPGAPSNDAHMHVVTTPTPSAPALADEQAVSNSEEEK